MARYHRGRAHVCATVLIFSVASLSRAQDAAVTTETDALRAAPCEEPALAQADRLACAARWAAAKDDLEREEIIKHYGAMAQGNRMEGDGVPTEAPPPDPAAAPEPAVTATADTREDLPSADLAWLLTLGGGAVVLGLVLAYGVTQRRRRGAAAKEAQDRGTNAAYGRDERPR